MKKQTCTIKGRKHSRKSIITGHTHTLSAELPCGCGVRPHEYYHWCKEHKPVLPCQVPRKQFADRYGHLGELVPLIYPDKVGQPDSILWAGEALPFWVNEIEEMNFLLSLWKMIQNRDIETLKKYIIWKQDPESVIFVRMSSDGTLKRGSVIASEQISPSLFYQLEWGEVIKPALYFLSNEIEQKLNGHVNPTFFLAQKACMVPDSLLSALYVLLLLEIQNHPIEPK
jgi:hypothetical protein